MNIKIWFEKLTIQTHHWVMQLYDNVMNVLNERQIDQPEPNTVSGSIARYGPGRIVYPRICQGTFKILVTEAYHRRWCYYWW